LSHIAEHDTDKILVVGDSLTSDMQGGRNAGLDTCLYDPQHKTDWPHLLCDYRIERLAQLLDFT
ncbi:MAG: HAD hydrolase-like protein, partial [Acutalibacteraceae bacterium]|nr:HAD hydrolase-like protein [Acutalibacteraceae bacterium]